MSDPEKSQSGGTSISSEGNTRVGGDVVGRDKIEMHQHYQQAPAEGKGWEAFYAAGCVARTLLILGILLVIAGFLAFFGTIFILSTTRTFEGSQAMAPFAAGSIGVVLVGMIITGIGSVMASHDLYRQRSGSRRQ